MTQLSQAQIKNVHSDYVCMMLPYPTMANDHLKVRRDYIHSSLTFNGPMELVSGPSGCWVADKVFPEHQNDKNAALSLKAALKGITLGLLAP